MRTWPALELELGDVDVERVQAALLDYDVAAIGETATAWQVFFNSERARDQARDGLRQSFPALRLGALDVPDEDSEWRRLDLLERLVRISDEHDGRHKLELVRQALELERVLRASETRFWVRHWALPLRAWLVAEADLVQSLDTAVDRDVAVVREVVEATASELADRGALTALVACVTIHPPASAISPAPASTSPIVTAVPADHAASWTLPRNGRSCSPCNVAL